jgi:hypothetical protein
MIDDAAPSELTTLLRLLHLPPAGLPVSAKAAIFSRTSGQSVQALDVGLHGQHYLSENG